MLHAALSISGLANRLSYGYCAAMDHHVYFWLVEEAKTSAGRADFEAALSGLLEIPAVRSGRWAVPAAVVLRPVVDQSWDYAVTLQFEDVSAHDDYQAHPLHVDFVNRYRPQWKLVQIRDLA